MKNYEEMSHDVLERISEYEAAKKRRKTIVSRTIGAVCPAVILAAAGIGAWKSGSMAPPENNFTNVVTVDTTSDISAEKSTVPVTVAQSAMTTAALNADTTAETSAVIAVETAAEVTSAVDDTADMAEETHADDTPSLSENAASVESDVTTQPMTEYRAERSESEASLSSEQTGGNDVCDILGYVYIDGELFMQFFPWEYGEAETYTFGEYIGCSTDFDGCYNSPNTHYYYSAEDRNVILVALWNGGCVTLLKIELPDGEKLTYVEGSPDWNLF